MNLHYASDSSGLAAGFSEASLYGAGAQSAHKPAEAQPQQAQATAAFNNAITYMPSASATSTMPQQQQQYQQPAQQQAQRSAPPPPQAPEQQVSQVQPAQAAQAQVVQQQPGAQQQNDEMFNMMNQQMYMMSGAPAGKGLQGAQGMPGMMNQDLTPQQLTQQQQQLAAWSQQNMMNPMSWGG